jgi:hypothetical protein
MVPAGEPRIPSEFRYWENLPKKPAQRMRAVLRALFRVDPQLPDDLVRTFAHAYYDADPVAEALAEDVHLPRGQAEGRRMIERALTGGAASVPDAPASLHRLFAELETKPAWLDEERVELGARVFRRWGVHVYSFAGAITLEGYRENSVAKPLAFTGAYTGESAARRFSETASFWIDVSALGALRPGGRGRAAAMRVRMMHVFVRKRLLAHPGWDLDAWGVPISQADAMMTLMGGSFIPGYGLRLLGYRTSREEIEATMHFWRYVGHLMGVQPRWFPQTIEDALGLVFTSYVKGAGLSGSDGANLARSYLDSYAPGPSDGLRARIRKRIEHGVQRGYVGWFVPGPTRALYGLPSPGLFRLHALAQAPFVFARETLRKASPRVDGWLDERARRETERWLRARLGHERAEFRAAERFTR